MIWKHAACLTECDHRKPPRFSRGDLLTMPIPLSLTAMYTYSRTPRISVSRSRRCCIPLGKSSASSVRKRSIDDTPQAVPSRECVRAIFLREERPTGLCAASEIRLLSTVLSSEERVETSWVQFHSLLLGGCHEVNASVEPTNGHG